MSPEINNKLTDWLKKSRTQYRVIEHGEIDGTARGSSEVTGTKPEQGAKALIMMVSEKDPVMVVLRGPDRVDFKAIKKMVGSDNVRMASGDEIKKITPIMVGALHPFGNLLNLKTYVDIDLLEEGQIACGTGTTTETVVLKAEDYKRIVDPVVGNFAKKE